MYFRDVKPRCFLSIRDYSAATATLPHPGGKTPTGGQGIYDKADGSRGVDGLGRLGSNSGRQPLKLSVSTPLFYNEFSEPQALFGIFAQKYF